MNSILKWLHKNDALVHMVVMLLVFYGIPTAALAVVYPSLVAPLTNSAIVGLTLVFLLYVSYKAASAVTDMIKNAAARSLLDQIRNLPVVPASPEKAPIVDYTSSNVLVVGSTSSEKKQDTVAKSASTLAQQEPAKKKRGPRAKTVKKEG